MALTQTQTHPYGANAWRLVADVGGTNVRFARAGRDGEPRERRAYQVAGHTAFETALERYLDETGREGCIGAAIGAAGPVEGGAVTLTNAAWTLREPIISSRLGGVPVRIVNDLEAVAHALPYLKAHDLAAVGPVAAPDPARAMIAVNVGTGFGAASIAPCAAVGWITRASEAGHMSLAPVTDAERAALAGIDTVEELLSGRGVAALYARLAGSFGPAIGAEEIMAKAGRDAAAASAVAIVGGILGRVAGDLVLASDAWGGCLLCGSVATGWAQAGDHPAFRAAFERKGPMSGRMSRVYSGVVRRADAALLGLAKMPLGG